MTSRRVATLCATNETQLKTFTKWANSQLSKHELVGRTSEEVISDFSTDFRDGKKLLMLVEVLSGERLPRPERQDMRIHHLQNVGKTLRFLKSKHGVALPNISAEDIVDGNLKLSLGLMWHLITMFQLQQVSISADNNKAGQVLPLHQPKMPSSCEEKFLQTCNVPPLLAWCQNQLAQYVIEGLLPIVKDFTVSWRDGLAFLGLIHCYSEELLPNFFEDIQSTVEHADKAAWKARLAKAFYVAEKRLGSLRLLEPNDVVDVEIPDARSVMTCVSGWYLVMIKGVRPFSTNKLPLDEASNCTTVASLAVSLYSKKPATVSTAQKYESRMAQSTQKEKTKTYGLQILEPEASSKGLSSAEVEKRFAENVKHGSQDSNISPKAAMLRESMTAYPPAASTSQATPSRARSEKTLSIKLPLTSRRTTDAATSLVKLVLASASANFLLDISTLLFMLPLLMVLNIFLEILKWTNLELSTASSETRQHVVDSEIEEIEKNVMTQDLIHVSEE